MRMGAVIPRYNLLNLYDTVSQLNKEDVVISSIPFVLDDFAEAIDHSSVMICSWFSNTNLQLSGYSE